MAELLVDVSLPLGPRTLHVNLRMEGRTGAIVGPSGAGKSTLLRVVAGLEKRAHGTIVVAGQTWQTPDARFVPPWERRVGWVPQDGVLFPHLSVRENLMYAAKLDIVPIAEMLGVANLLDRQPRRLSGGERQRVALGRALAASPRLLLLDEPFSALDRPLRAQLGDAVANWVRSRAIALLVVTHDPSDVAVLAEEAWEIRDDVLRRTCLGAVGSGQSESASCSSITAIISSGE